jgi:hypothetical protein
VFCPDVLAEPVPWLAEGVLHCQPLVYQAASWLGTRGRRTETGFGRAYLSMGYRLDDFPPMDQSNLHPLGRLMAFYTGLQWPDYQPPLCDVAVDERDNTGLAVGYDVSRGRERLFVQTEGNRLATVADGVRQVGEEASCPYPWVDRLADGRWRVGCFSNSRYREWCADDPTGAWTATADDAIGSVVNLASACHRRGRTGRQLVAGYHVGEGCVYLFERTAPDSPWTGPYLGVAVPVAVLPYVTELPDGRVECGWYDGSAWTRYRADGPDQTWGEVP